MRKIYNGIRTWLRWMFSKDVLDAINAGASYDEVKAIAEGRHNG